VGVEMKKKKFEKLDFTVIDPGDKLIIQYPKILGAVYVERLIVMARKFLRDPHENVLVAPSDFKFFLLKKGSDLRVEIEGQ
jgi:uncharacterized membrane protein